MTILTIVFIVIIANTALLIGIAYKESVNNSLTTDQEQNNETFVTNFSQYISESDGELAIQEEGLQVLKDRNAWIQILDENGQEVLQKFAPTEAPTHYRPVDMIQYYKYREYDRATTIYVSSFDNYSYLVGIRDSNIQRLTFIVNKAVIVNTIFQYMLYIIIADLLIALLAGLMFGSILTKPLYVMMDSIQQLKNRNFHLKKVKRPGIYKQVFTNLQEVSGELEKQEQERQKLEQMRNEWISNISHDMKTPLASIQGYAELLRDDAKGPEQQQYAEVIERKAIYMRELIDDFNLTMKLREQKLPLQLTDVRVEKLVRDLVIDVLNDPQFAMRDIQFDSSTQLTLPLDAHLMKRALQNFIVNALIHNPNDTAVTVTVRDQQSCALIEIRDNGRGMTDEEVEHIFERYYRGSNTENIRGTGLGTAIARDIIVAHGGHVSIASEVGKGTTVTIRLGGGS